MSYILEALKKADAERERGAVPDLHAQPVPLTAAYDDPPPRGPKPWLWLAAGAAIALVAVLAWRFGSGGDDAAPGGVAAVAPPVATSAVPSPAASPPTAPPPAQVEAEPPPVPAPRPAPPPPAREPTAPAPQRARPEPRPPVRAAPAVVAPASGPATGAAAKASTKTPPAAASRAPSLAELPEDFRRQVPAMTIGGSVYSSQASNRMVIVNGQVFREGDTVTPGLMLEQIGPKAAVFSLRGQRFEMPF